MADGGVAAGPFRFGLPTEVRGLRAGALVVVGIRPENLAVCPPSDGGAPASVTQATDLGHDHRVTLNAPGVGPMVAFAPKAERIAPGNCAVAPRSALLYAADKLVGAL